MMRFLLLYCFFFFNLSCFGQTLYLKINGSNSIESKIIDSIGYTKSFKEAKLLLAEANIVSEKLQKKGFLESEIVKNTKPNDSTFLYEYSLGKKTNFIHIYIDNDNKELLNESANDIVLPFASLEMYMTTAVKKLEQRGYPLAKVFLNDFENTNNTLKATLVIATEKKRTINEVVFNGYEKFPVGFKKNINRIYRKKLFSKTISDKIYKEINTMRFIKQAKYPEVLFTKDSTKVFVYTEKTKANTFDGFVGFGNDDGKKLIFSGYIDVSLLNILNSGEKMTLNWKSNGKSQKTFQLGVELPYIFKSPLGLKTQLNIFKQDSTFQNTQTAIELGYYFNYNTRAYLGYQSLESSDIKNQNTTTLSDFNNSFITTHFEYIAVNSTDFLFPEKSSFSFKIGTGKRASKFQDNKQFFGSLFLQHHFYLNSKNVVSLKSQNYYLQSGDYITNELYRFGGINSIRGFTENSLQATFTSSLLTEYCYILSPSIYAHTIIDYGYFQDKTTKLNGNVLGLGVGLAMLTKNGLLHIIYANGSSNQAIKLSNSVVQISLKARF
jgi:hypothetical protein